MARIDKLLEHGRGSLHLRQTAPIYRRRPDISSAPLQIFA